MSSQPLASAHSHLALAGRVRRRPERHQRATCSVERLEQLDADLARRSSEAGRLRFEIGVGLDLLERSGGHHALGFSSINAYALERCERSASWSQQARRLARRLEALPALADALISGSVTWSMAAVLATVAGPHDAEIWLAEASGRTNADLLLALVAESTSTLCNELPSRAIQLPDDDAINPQRAWERELARMRTEAEMRCESHFRRAPEPRPRIDRLHWPESPEAIDHQLRPRSGPGPT